MKTFTLKYKTFLAASFSLMFGLVSVQDANSRVMTNVEPDLSGEEVRAVVVEDFEDCQIAADKKSDGWLVSTLPKKYEKAETEEKLKRKDPILHLEMKLIEGGSKDMNPEQWSVTDKGTSKEKVLGLKFKFRYPGDNCVILEAPREIDWKTKKPVLRYNPASGKEEQFRGLQLPGRVQAISVWVHGRGNPYDLEAWLEDYRGDTHIIKLGSANFVGWRPMKAYIPISVPQTSESYPQTRVTRLTKLVLRAQTRVHYEELITDTYFFFDQIKVLTDTYEVNFDGQEMHEIFDGDGSSSSSSNSRSQSGGNRK